MSLLIRPEAPSDHPAIAVMESAALGIAVTPEMVGEEARATSFVAFVAQRDHRIIGRCKAGFMPEYTPTTDLRCSVVVEPSARRAGVGAALWEALQPIFRARGPAHLRANGNGLDPDSVAWAERRGFASLHRLLFQTLHLTDFDPAPWLPRMEALQAQGFQFVPYATLAAPENDAKLHRLYQQFLADTPDYTPGDSKPFDTWRSWAFESSHAWPQGWILLLSPDGEWVGFTFTQKSPPGAHVFMTGVLPTYRKKGLAIPLKVAAALYAKEQGIAHLTTLNHAANERILAVNRSLGYEVTEDVIRLVKRCDW